MESQIFIESPDLALPRRAVTLTSAGAGATLRHLVPPHLLPLSPRLFFSVAGRPLPLTSPLSSLPAPSPLLLLTLRLRLPGGGGDGGSTCAESRDCYLNMYATRKPDKPDPNETRLSKWTTCALSAEPLTPPLAADRLGNVFNKEPLVSALIHKTLPKQFAHIRGLKDIVTVELAAIPGVSAGAETRFQCPVSGLEFNGKYGFVMLMGCGHVLSTKAMREVKEPGCLVCRKEFGEADKVVINGTEEEVAVLRERMEAERGRGRERKEKKGGVKHGCGDAVGKKDGGGKRFKATDIKPVYASEVYASIFTSSKKKDFKETYSCRSLPLARN